MVKWCLKFQERGKSESFWSTEADWIEMTVYAETKTEAINKALKLCNCENYKEHSLVVKGEELLEKDNNFSST